MIGTGYVGLVSGVCFADLGNDVVCVDKDIFKINKLKKGIIPIYEPGLSELVKKNYKSGRLSFTTNLSEAIKNSQIIFICVGTPTKKNSNAADLSQVFNVAKEIGKFIKVDNYGKNSYEKVTSKIGSNKACFDLDEGKWVMVDENYHFKN